MHGLQSYHEFMIKFIHASKIKKFLNNIFIFCTELQHVYMFSYFVLVNLINSIVLQALQMLYWFIWDGELKFKHVMRIKINSVNIDEPMHMKKL